MSDQDHTKEVTETVQKAAQEGAEKVKEILSDALEGAGKINDKAKDAGHGPQGNVQAGVDTTKDLAKEVKDSPEKAVEKAADQAKEVGKKVEEGTGKTTEGVSQETKEVKETLPKAAEKVGDKDQAAQTSHQTQAKVPEPIHETKHGGLSKGRSSEHIEEDLEDLKKATQAALDQGKTQNNDPKAENHVGEKTAQSKGQEGHEGNLISGGVDTVKDGAETIKNLTSDGLGKAVDITKSGFGMVFGMFSTVYDKTKGVVVGATDMVVDGAKVMKDKAEAGVSIVKDGVKDGVGKGFDVVKSAKDSVGDGLSKVKHITVESVEKGIDVAKDAKDKVKDGASQLKHKAEAGIEMGKAVADDVKEKAGDGVKQIKQTTEDGKHYINDDIQIKKGLGENPEIKKDDNSPSFSQSLSKGFSELYHDVGSLFGDALGFVTGKKSEQEREKEHAPKNQPNVQATKDASLETVPQPLDPPSSITNHSLTVHETVHTEEAKKEVQPADPPLPGNK